MKTQPPARDMMAMVSGALPPSMVVEAIPGSVKVSFTAATLLELEAAIMLVVGLRELPLFAAPVSDQSGNG